MGGAPPALPRRNTKTFEKARAAAATTQERSNVDASKGEEETGEKQRSLPTAPLCPLCGEPMGTDTAAISGVVLHKRVKCLTKLRRLVKLGLSEPTASSPTFCVGCGEGFKNAEEGVCVGGKYRLHKRFQCMNSVFLDEGKDSVLALPKEESAPVPAAGSASRSGRPLTTSATKKEKNSTPPPATPPSRKETTKKAASSPATPPSRSERKTIATTPVTPPPRKQSMQQMPTVNGKSTTTATTTSQASPNTLAEPSPPPRKSSTLYTPKSRPASASSASSRPSSGSDSESSNPFRRSLALQREKDEQLEAQLEAQLAAHEAAPVLVAVTKVGSFLEGAALFLCSVAHAVHAERATKGEATAREPHLCRQGARTDREAAATAASQQATEQQLGDEAGAARPSARADEHQEAHL